MQWMFLSGFFGGFCFACFLVPRLMEWEKRRKAGQDNPEEVGRPEISPVPQYLRGRGKS